MLRALDINDFVIIERAALEFGPGFSVLTGETGAGKSMLVDEHGGAAALARDTAVAFRDWKRLEALAAEAEKSFSAREAERAGLQESSLELKKLSLRPGEWESISAEHARLQHGSSLLGG